MLKKLTGMDVIEKVIQDNPSIDALSFTNRMNEIIGIKGQLVGEISSPVRSTVFVSTHHTGALDYLATFPLLAGIAPDLKVALNEKILAVTPLRQIAIPVHPISSGRSNARATGEMLAHLKRGGNLLIYPAGKVGHKKNGKILDSEWISGLGKLIQKGATQVIPVYVDAENSNAFYQIRRLFPALSMLYLLRTVMKRKPVQVPVLVGPPAGNTLTMEELRKLTYNLKKDI